MLSDLMLTCRECGKKFSFTSSQQAAHTRRGFTNQPTRCPDCRANRRASRTITRSTSNGDRRQTYSTVCASCGADTTLPFKPGRDRPGYCPSCFQARLHGTRSAGTNKVIQGPEERTGKREYYRYHRPCHKREYYRYHRPCHCFPGPDTTGYDANGHRRHGHFYADTYPGRDDPHPPGGPGRDRTGAYWLREDVGVCHPARRAVRSVSSRRPGLCLGAHP